MTQLLWEDPLPIRYPEPLGDEQLTASVADRTLGTVIYDPPRGTILPPGEHTLHAIFKPTPYGVLPSTTSVIIEVTRGFPKLDWPTPPSILEGQGILLQLLCCRCVNIKPVLIPVTLTETDHNANEATASTIPEVVDMNNINQENQEKSDFNDSNLLDQNDSVDKETAETTNEVIIVKKDSFDEGEFVYNPPAGTILPPGVHVLRVHYSPPKDVRHLWEDADFETTLFVRTKPKAHPEIRWHVQEEPFSYPLRLDNSILNAKTNVSGSITYDPPPDTLLDVGVHMITVSFKPYDTKNFLEAEVTAAITVVKGMPTIVWTPSEPELTYGKSNYNNLNESFTYS